MATGRLRADTDVGRLDERTTPTAPLLGSIPRAGGGVCDEA
ncbi:MAG TPA: hypothetical protein VL856_12120 [Acidimicrobiia bacterium]|nr:hypothetical protein [Acidimicrobiia bacterium]